MTKHEQYAHPKACIITILKDLSAVCCANPPGYYRNLSDFSKISELARKCYWKSNQPRIIKDNRRDNRFWERR